MRMNNLLISGTILKEKAIIYGQELQVEEFHGRVYSMILSKLFLEKEKQ